MKITLNKKESTQTKYPKFTQDKKENIYIILGEYEDIAIKINKKLNEIELIDTEDCITGEEITSGKLTLEW